MEFVLHPPWAASPSPNGYIKPRRRIFDDFLSLSSATHQQIYEFASKFGPLLVYCRVKSLFEEGQLLVQERSEVWRYLARCMKSLLRIAAGLHMRRGDQTRDWDVIGQAPFAVSSVVCSIKKMDLLNPCPFLPEEDWSVRANFIVKGQSRDRDMWVGLLNNLLELGRCRPWVVWQGNRTSPGPRIVYCGPSLLSFLSLQVCLTALKQDAFAVCSFCNTSYTSARAPKAGQRNFCHDCRKSGKPVLVAQRTRRARIREAR
jgi:hypothetical protein